MTEEKLNLEEMLSLAEKVVDWKESCNENSYFGMLNNNNYYVAIYKGDIFSIQVLYKAKRIGNEPVDSKNSGRINQLYNNAKSQIEEKEKKEIDEALKYARDLLKDK
jgi:hypothetical protein